MNISDPVLVADHVCKAYGPHVALDDVTLSVPPGRVVGLLGPNGAGKTTLLHGAAGLAIPTRGSFRTLGARADALEAAQLERLGLALQEGRFIEWMTVTQHAEFTASFYPRWDVELERRLTQTLDIPVGRKLADLSPGDRQKVSLLLAVCHRPALLLLDEPMSALDPIARATALNALIDRLREDACTIVVSSHLLGDVEKIVDWVVVLDRGRLTESTPFDELQESFAEWVVTAPDDRLLPSFDEPFVRERTVSGRVARVVVRTTESDAASRFAAAHGVTIQSRPLNLEEMFPHLIDRRKGAA